MIEEGGVFWTPERAKPGVALLRDGERWLEFSDPIETRTAQTLDEVIPLLEWAEERSRAAWSVGAVCYEASPAFDSALASHAASGPLAQFSIYSSAQSFPWVAPPPIELAFTSIVSEMSKGHYLWKVQEILNEIAAGRIYQTNLTFRIRGVGNGDPVGLFLAVINCMECIPPYTALLIQDDGAVLSWSPELFFSRHGSRLTCKPMKGTRPAAGDPHELAANPKDQAENLMIVDMIRNDLGRIAVTGSVRVPNLFEIERHSTVLQMTSTVEADISVRSNVDVFRALFPCASVVGAPKIEASRVIVEQEVSARGVYCGAIGYMAPGDRARFSVAIRTMTCTHDGSLSYGTGSGIVHDSVPDDEFQECTTKLEILNQIRTPMALLETLPGGFVATTRASVEAHLDRMEASAVRLRFAFNREDIREKIDSVLPSLKHPKRVRVMVWPHGVVDVKCEPLNTWLSPIRVQICPWPVYSGDEWLRHKTTRRALYARARAACPEEDEVLLWNERGELTEFTIGNLVVELDGELWTPPLECGLLPGIQRAVEVESGKVKERVIMKNELQRATKIWHINSVRGWTEVEMIPALG